MLFGFGLLISVLSDFMYDNKSLLGMCFFSFTFFSVV